MATSLHALRSAIAWSVHNREPSLLLAPAALLLGIFFFIPLAGLLSLSLLDPGPTFAHYQEFLGNPTNWIILARTFALATKVTLICLLLGYPLAFWIVSARTWVAAALLLAVVLSFFTSYLVRTYAWMVLLGRFGVINQLLMALGLTERPLDLIYNQFSVLVAMVYILMPYTVLVLTSVMGRDSTRSDSRCCLARSLSGPELLARILSFERTGRDRGRAARFRIRAWVLYHAGAARRSEYDRTADADRHLCEWNS